MYIRMEYNIKSKNTISEAIEIDASNVILNYDT